MKNSIKYAALLAAAASIITGTASAQNPNYKAGDLVLSFQQDGGTNTAYINLGDSAAFRGTAAGAADGVNQVNYLNINTTLTAAFGATWASNPTIYAGIAGVWGTSNTSSILQNGDPHRTIYVSASRGTVGTVGTGDSNPWSLTGSTAPTATSGAILTQNNVFEVNYMTGQEVSPTSVSRIDDQQPFFSPGVQGTAFGSFASGIQQAGTAGTFGTFGDAGEVEFALDLYRILARNNISGQVGGNVGAGSYEGTFTVNSAGNVSFIATPTVIPEPSSLGLAGIAAAALILRRRRNA